MVAWAVFAYAAMSNTSVDMSSVPALDFDCADHFFQCCEAPSHCFEEQLDPQALGRMTLLWDISGQLSGIDTFNHNDEDETSCEEEGSNRHSQVIWEQQPEEVVHEYKSEPSEDLTLVQ